MTRREFISTASAAATARAASPHPLTVPVHLVTDIRPAFTPAELNRFYFDIWGEAVRDFARCGVVFRISEATGEIQRSPGGRPVFKGLERGTINVVLTRHIPMAWDDGRNLAGLSTRYELHDLSVIALANAHAHQFPFVSVNTCVHELLHVLMGDVLVSVPGRLERSEHEFRIDWLATRLWLFHDGDAIREAVQGCRSVCGRWPHRSWNRAISIVRRERPAYIDSRLGRPTQQKPT